MHARVCVQNHLAAFLARLASSVEITRVRSKVNGAGRGQAGAEKVRIGSKSLGGPGSTVCPL